jgi:hypothetical protein
VVKHVERVSADETPGMRYFSRPFMSDYARWYKNEFGCEPPKVVELEGDSPSFQFKMGYTAHSRPLITLIQTLRDIKRGMGKEDFFEVHVRDDKGNSLRTSYMDDMINLFSNCAFLTEGANLNVGVEKGPGGQFSRKAGWIAANLLADPSFDYECNLPKVDLKRRKLLECL